MKPLNNYILPVDNSQGLFGAIRKHDIHTGIDLYCEKHDIVYAIEDGIKIRNLSESMLGKSHSHSEKSKKIISEKRKEYLKNNADKHNWKSNNKFRSIPFRLKYGYSSDNYYVDKYES